MRISDWSSDVCSSDLNDGRALLHAARGVYRRGQARRTDRSRVSRLADHGRGIRRAGKGDRKRVASGKSVSVRVDNGGRRSITKKKHENDTPETYQLNMEAKTAKAQYHPKTIT